MAAAGCTAARALAHAHRRGLERSRRANWKHGHPSAEAIAQRKEAAAIGREISLLIRPLNAEEQTPRDPSNKARLVTEAETRGYSILREFILR